MVTDLVSGIALVFVAAAAGTPASVGGAALDAPQPFRPAGRNAWDFWFAKDGDTYHAFYLEYPDQNAQPDQSRRHGGQWVGHAVSKDLVHWRERPTALREPGKGIATGSVVRHQGRWYLLVTHQGLRLAESDDLDTWRWSDDGQVYGGEVMQAEWQGAPVSFRMLADPYLYPEMRDGWWYAAVNSHILGTPEGERGAQVLIRSRDLRRWEGYKVIAFPRRFERMETAQIWKHAGRWYCYFGGVMEKEGKRRNFNGIYLSERFDGPYEAKPWSEVHLPGVPNWYIGKREVGPDGRDVFLAGQSYSSLSLPVPMSYEPDGRAVFGGPLGE